MCKVRLPSQHYGDGLENSSQVGAQFRLCSEALSQKQPQQTQATKKPEAGQRLKKGVAMLEAPPVNRFLLLTSPRRNPAALLGSQCPFHAGLPPLWYSVRFSDTPVPPGLCQCCLSPVVPVHLPCLSLGSPLVWCVKPVTSMHLKRWL